jgi:hypothetical protein
MINKLIIVILTLVIFIGCDASYETSTEITSNGGTTTANKNTIISSPEGNSGAFTVYYINGMKYVAFYKSGTINVTNDSLQNIILKKQLENGELK